MSHSLNRGRQVLRVRYPAHRRARLHLDGADYPVVDLSSEGLRVALVAGQRDFQPGAEHRGILKLLHDVPAVLHRLRVLRATPTAVALGFLGAGVSFSALLDEWRRVFAFDGI